MASKPKNNKETPTEQEFYDAELAEEQNEVIYDTTQDVHEFNSDIPETLPVLPLKDMVVFPYMMFPILAGRESTIAAVNSSVEKDKFILLVAQVDEKIEEPTFENLYNTGTVAKIIQVLRLPNGLIKVLVDGLFAADVKKFHSGKFISATFEIKNPPFRRDNELEALMRQATKLFTDYVQTNRTIPQETLVAYENIKEPDRRLYYIASTINAGVPKKQKILAIGDLHKQYYEILYIMSSEMEILNVEKEIDEKIYQTMQKNQRKFIVQEQIRILQDELGEGVETDPEMMRLRDKIETSGMPEAIVKKAQEEFSKLKKTPTMSPDYSVLRNYLDWMVSVPWAMFTDDNFDLKHAKKILDEDHYGLDKAKDRVLELIAVLKLLKAKNIRKSPKGQILCFVGPPGVGKTSLGKSIARALNRNFVRISVGGVRDEAEIRGHRRTYIGAMPGKIIQAMKKAGSVNPVLLIDEIDKMSNDFRGDPASAMLEVLDPEQNSTFNDHYLDVDYDLSNVLFITTANVYYSIPLPLLDRMEIIEMRSYLDFEKVEIAKRHIIPKELSEHGVQDMNVTFPDKVILKVISEYTREAGVRSLERELSSIIRKVTREIVETPASKAKKAFAIKEEMVEKYLGVPKYKTKLADVKEKSKIGSVVGLAWTSMGGDILNVDVTIMNGPNKFILTGKLGDIMKESAQAGLSYIKSNAAKFGIPPTFFKEKEIHIHLPEGAIPKDGPSAGITMIMAMLSAITKSPVRPDVAMTGEITLRGNVLPIGGLNEKLLAAVRSGIKTVLIPAENEKDLVEIQKEILDQLEIVLVDNVEDGVKHVFTGKKIKFTK